MPFVRKTDSQGFRPQIDVRKIFIGRAQELHFFREHILKPEDPVYNIVSISGQGGVGKSTLLLRFVDDAHATDFKDYCLTALVNERHTTASSIMEKFADQLHLEGDFEKELKRYKEALRKIQSQHEATRETLARRLTTDVIGSAIKDVPFVGGMLKEGAEAATSYLFDELHYRQLLKDAERMENPIANLTKAFVAELNRLAEIQVIVSSTREKKRHRIILFFDTFEHLAAECAPWLLDYFLETDVNNNVVLVIAGRDPLEHSTLDDPKRWLLYRDNNTIYSIFLDSFTQEETRNYLAERGITDTSRIETIWQLSRGLPLYLGFLTSNPQGIVDPTANVVANFLRWIPEQEQVKRRLALDAALFSRPFNQDELGAFTYISEHDRPFFYRWLISQPFVRSNLQDGKYSYHELAQELFSRYLYQLSQSEYRAARDALAEYYQELLKNIEAKGGRNVYKSAQWLELTLALTKQLLLISDEDSIVRAIELLLNVYYHEEQEGVIVRLLRNLSQEQLNNLITIDALHAIKQLLQYIEADPSIELLEAANGLIEKVTQKPTFSSELSAKIYYSRGISYRTLANAYYSRGVTYKAHEDYQRALADLDRAIELNPQYTDAYHNRGAIYLDLKDYSRAVVELDRAIELNPKDALAYSNRGIAYRSLKDSQRALADLDRAIELDPKDAYAYYYRGRTYYALKDYERTIEDCTRAIELDPKDADTYYRRGYAYLWRRDLIQAKTDFSQSWQTDSTNLNHGWMIEFVEMCQQKPDFAIVKRLEALAQVDLQHSAAYICRGVVQWIQGNFGKALEELEHASKLNPDSEDALFWKGIVYASLQENNAAIADLEKSLELGLPPVLLTPLRWFEQDRPEFYERYAKILIAQFE